MNHFRFRTTLLVLLSGLQSLMAQPVLLPSLGLDALPQPNDPICTLPLQTPPLASNGRQAGEHAAGFQLYDLGGVAFDLEEALMQGKPVLMIAGSYTCPVFRNRMPLINTIQQNYSDQLTTVIVYTAEAHPYLDISPYFGVVNTGAANINAGILYTQPMTYGERTEVAGEMLNAITIDVPVLLDGPCNEWWNYYGPAPNIAYLIDTTGMIVARHTWLDQYPQNIICDIDAVLGIPNDCAEVLGGTFTVEWITNDTVYGDVGSTITVTTRLTNSTNNPVLVEVHRLENNMPPGWSSALCLDVCYMPEINYTEVLLAGNSQMDFHYYFYTSGTPAHGHARVGLRNAEQYSNGFMMNFHAFSSPATFIAEHEEAITIHLWPNPTSGIVHVTSALPYDLLTVHDLHGRMVLRSSRADHLDLGALNSGLYMVRAWSNGHPLSEAVRVQRW